MFEIRSGISIYNFRLFYFASLLWSFKEKNSNLHQFQGTPYFLSWQVFVPIFLSAKQSALPCYIYHTTNAYISYTHFNIIFLWVELIHFKQNLCHFSSHLDHFNKFKKANHKQTITDLIESLIVMAWLIMQSHCRQNNERRSIRIASSLFNKIIHWGEYIRTEVKRPVSEYLCRRDKQLKHILLSVCQYLLLSH